MLLSRREVVAARDLKTEARVVMARPVPLRSASMQQRGRCGAAVGAQQSREALACAQIDEDRDALAAQPSSLPGRRADARNMCYIIFTSGSTGRPKGAVLQHDGSVNFMHFIHRCAHARVAGQAGPA